MLFFHVNMENATFLLKCMTFNIINFCRPRTSIFYFVLLRKRDITLRHPSFHDAKEISYYVLFCDNFTVLKVCPYMRIFPLLNRFICFLNIIRVRITENRHKPLVKIVLCTIHV